MAKLKTIIRGKDFKFNIGPLFDSIDTEQLSPINITNLDQLVVSTFTDERFLSVSVLKTPTTGQWELIKVTDFIYTVIIPDVDTAKMKVGFATIRTETTQADVNYPDGFNNQAGEAIRFEVIDL